MFDTHCHFEKGMDIPALLQRAREAGLIRLLATGGAPDADDGAFAAADVDPELVHVAVGTFPELADAFASPESRAIRLDHVRRLAAHPAVRAIGEIGLEYSHGESPETRRAQRELFAAHVRLAGELGLPCSIHCRGAEEDLVAILQENASPELVATGRTGALHCFVGPLSFAEKLLPLGLSFGLSGILTFQNAHDLRAAVAALPRERLLSETDAPYLSPVPVRGSVCEPAFVAHTVARLADILGLTPAEAAALTLENANRIFLP